MGGKGAFPWISDPSASLIPAWAGSRWCGSCAVCSPARTSSTSAMWARVPYGTRSREVIYRYASEDLRFLRDRKVKLIIAACGTASSVIDSALTDRLPMPYTGVIEPTARAAAAATRNKKVGIIGHRRHHPQRLLCTGTPCHRPRHRNGGSGLCPAGAAGGKRLHRL